MAVSSKIIVHIITGLNDGGAEAALFRLCVNDPEDIHNVISLTGAGKYGPLLKQLGISVTALDMPRGRVRLSGLWILWRTIRHIKPQAVQTWMYHSNLLGGLAARFAGQNNIIWGIHHSDLASSGTSHHTLAVARLCAWFSRLLPRNIISCAQKAADVHAAFGYDAKRLHVVPNGYDLERFRPDPDARAAVRSELGLAQDQQVIGFVARYDPLKDHGNLLQALALLKEQGQAPACLLIGTGMDEGNVALLSLIAGLGLSDQIYLLGQRNDIPAVMSALDLHIMSSASEAFPNVLAEAMACGTPCVTTDVGDAAVIVGDTGWVVPAQDSVALAEAISHALQKVDAQDWNSRKASARARVEQQFSIDRMVRSYRAIWGV
ncbi:glycosyltransferase (plasmid) [Sphingobium yanoikuyae]|uniref:Glycosyltransferase n=1 Tax=Sphingobium yanoikuyae TaxID=13690 RepID=A0A6M4GG55_SPHYA|nr:glycosyltransferase [Sphingobium yanoikuyae]QJR06239.1 glycosyltransferase [Sphingobium yanoikuyae]